MSMAPRERGRDGIPVRTRKTRATKGDPKQGFFRQAETIRAVYRQAEMLGKWFNPEDR